jgi:hypothetical protein
MVKLWFANLLPFSSALGRVWMTIGEVEVGIFGTGFIGGTT